MQGAAVDAAAPFHFAPIVPVVISAPRKGNNISRCVLMSHQVVSDQAGATSRLSKRQIGGTNDAYSRQDFFAPVFWSRSRLARDSRGSTGASAGGRHQFL